jgi:negative regulator of replication initiation
MTRAVSRVARLLASLYASKESKKRFVQATQRILRHLCIYSGYVQVYFSNVRQFRTLLNEANRLVPKSVGFRPFLKSGVVELLADPEPLLKDLNDAFRRLSNLILVGFQ